MSLFDKEKNAKIIIYSLLILIIFIIIFFSFKIKVLNEKMDRMSSRRVSKNNSETIDKTDESVKIPSPDRIIYKNSNNEYKIIKSDSDIFTDIYYELNDRVFSTIEGKVYTEDEISQMQENGSFIELDYNTKSKNYIFMLEEDEIGIIKRSSDNGQVIQTSLKDKNYLVNMINDLTKDDFIKYDFDKENNYTSENQLPDISSDLNLIKTSTTGVYKKVIENNENEYNNILEKLNFKTDKNLPKVDFDKQSVVIIASINKIKSVKQNIGNLKFELGDFIGKYEITLLIVSKVVNTNCIYFNIDENDSNISKFVENNNEDEIEYYVQDGKYYANINNEKTEIISIEKAADIAEEEAKKDIYQYQEWKSDFYTRENEADNVSGTLIYGNNEANMRFYHWYSDWQVKDYQGKTIWVIDLFDRNDPLTNLYIFVDAINGEVIGAGQSSD